MKKNKKIFFGLGIMICLTGATLMFDGAILGEKTVNVAIILGITGISLIATQRKVINKGDE